MEMHSLMAVTEGVDGNKMGAEEVGEGVRTGSGEM